MAYSNFIGARYLSSRKKRSISAIGVIAISGVALGVAALLVVISIASGFQDEFTKKVLGVNSHVLVMKYGLDFTEYRDVIAKAEKLPEVRGVAPFVIQEMMISKEANTSGVLLKGVDPHRLGDVLDLPNHLVQGGLEGLRIPGAAPAADFFTKKTPLSLIEQASRNLESPDGGPPPSRDVESPTKKSPPADPSGNDGAQKPKLPGIILGKTLAENLEANLGDQVQVTTPTLGLDLLGWSAAEATPRTLSFRVVGIFYAGFLEYDTRLAYVDYYQAQRFFDYGDSVTGVEITLKDIHTSKKVAQNIKSSLGPGPYRITIWQQLNESLFTALKMQKVVLTIVLAVIVGVAAFNIIATLVMMVFDKRREIAILKSMGATHGEIARIFLYVGTVVGLIGIAIGLTVGFGVCFLLKEVGWPLDPKVYLIDHLPVRIEIMDFVITSIVAFTICLLATILPSLSASALHPVDGIRND